MTKVQNAVSQIANSQGTLEASINRINSAISQMYEVTKGEDPRPLGWFSFSKDVLPAEYFSVVKTILQASPALYKAVIRNNYAPNPRDYFIKFPLLAVYTNLALDKHASQKNAIYVAIFEALEDYFDTFPPSPGGYLESLSDWVFRDAHAFMDDVADARPESYEHVDTRLENDVLSRAISLLNSLVIKLRDNDIGLSEDEEFALRQLNYAELTTQMRDLILGEGAASPSQVTAPSGETLTIAADGEIIARSPTTTETPVPSSKPIKKGKSTDFKKIGLVSVGIAALALTIRFALKKRNT